MKRQRPAFSRAILDQRSLGKIHRRGLVIAADWELYKKWHGDRIVVDPNSTPSEIDFTVCSGLDCMLVGERRSRMDEIAFSVLNFNPVRLIGVDIAELKIVVYRSATRN